MRPLAVALALVVAPVPPLVAQQGPWVPPEPSCGLQPGHFRINSAVLNLKLAAEQPVQRDRMLRQAQDVLARAIRDDKQDKNPAAWYYLGRYYVEIGDAVGADTAFDRAEALAPQCTADIRGYRATLAEDVMNRGLTVWQAGSADSAAVLLRQANALDPSRPKALFQLGSLYAGQDQLDSAAAVLQEAARVAGTDTAYAESKRDALHTIARLAFRRSLADVAVQKWQRSRFSRDSVAPWIANDSTIMARMQQSSASRRARGARLSAADQQSFSRDSSLRADSLARRRATQDGQRQQAAVDSAAAQPALEPAIAAYRSLVAAYPSNAEATTTLSAVYAQAGRMGEAVSAFDGLFAHPTALSATEWYDLGQRLVQGKLSGPGTKAYLLALQQNPFHRNALSEIANVHLATKDTAAALAMAQRLGALDPRNKATLRLLRQAWDLRGRRDSAQKYGTLGDTLTVELTVASLVVDSSAATVAGVASNTGGAPSKPLRVTFEFLDAQGAVQGSQTVDITAIQPGGNQEFTARSGGRGIVGWRYRPS
jgi:tetratricopeptide (TPR) repeat protein